MKNKIFNIKTVHTNVHKIITIRLQQKNYSLPKLYIAKELINGKKVPSVAAGKNWHVYYYYRCPENNKLKKFSYKFGINRFKTIKERREYGKQLIQAFTELLDEGFNPFTQEGMPVKPFEEKIHHTLKTALDFFKTQILKDLKESSITDYNYRLGRFEKWAKENAIYNNDIETFTKRHISSFFDSLGEQSATSINNYQRVLSAFFGFLSKESIVKYNFIKEMHKRKSKPKKNIPFTPSEIEKIINHLKTKDPYLIGIIKFIYFGFLREIEVGRLHVDNIDLETNVYRVETKKDVFKTKVLIPQLREVVLEQLKLNSSGFLFTKHFKPGPWHVKKEASKREWFSNRFLKIKRELGFSSSYGLYSFRHSAAIENYNFYKNKGFNEFEIIQKMLPITGHKNEASLRAYLRDIDSNLPKGYGSNYSVTF